MPLKVGGRTFRVEASLVDRGHMSYPAIVGQDVLSEGGFKVEVNGHANGAMNGDGRVNGNCRRSEAARDTDA